MREGEIPGELQRADRDQRRQVGAPGHAQASARRKRSAPRSRPTARRAPRRTTTAWRPASARSWSAATRSTAAPPRQGVGQEPARYGTAMIVSFCGILPSTVANRQSMRDISRSMTFSIVGRCSITGQFGAVTATSNIAVGARVAHCAAGVGAMSPSIAPIPVSATRPRPAPVGLFGAGDGRRAGRIHPARALAPDRGGGSRPAVPRRSPARAPARK